MRDSWLSSVVLELLPRVLDARDIPLARDPFRGGRTARRTANHREFVQGDDSNLTAMQEQMESGDYVDPIDHRD